MPTLEEMGLIILCVAIVIGIGWYYRIFEK